MVRYVYADIVFFINALMNYLLLWATARLLRRQLTPGRGLAAALLGAAYAVGLLLPGLASLYSGAGKLVFAGFMLAVAFPGGVRQWARAGACFLCLTWLVAGAAFAAHFLLGAGSTDGPVRWWVLLVAAVGCAGPVRLVWHLGSRQQWRRSHCLPVEVVVGAGRVQLVALLDTGNQLSDPLTGLPVIVAEHAVLAPLLPAELALAPAERMLELAAGGLPPALSTRLRVVPYRGLGGSSGLMVGFRPDRVVLQVAGVTVACDRVVVAVCDHALSADGAYQALIPPELLDAA